MGTVSDYELQVTINSFSNPSGRCADENCADRCCDGTCPSSCHYFFSLCQRPAGADVSTLRHIYQGECEARSTKNSLISVSDGSSFTNSVFGTPNPIIFTGGQWPNGGLQLYVEILDKDRSSAILVDRFAIDITPPVDITVSGRQTYSGVFGLAEMDLTIGLESTQATEGYRSADYNNGHQCVDWENSFTCDCRESFTGPPCADIDFCAGPAVCKLNRSCMNNHTCVCGPGNAGSECSTELDACTGVDCNNGECSATETSFVCICNDGFTGEDCEETTTPQPRYTNVAIVMSTLAAAIVLVVLVVLVARKCKQLKKFNNLNCTVNNRELPSIDATDILSQSVLRHDYDYPYFPLNSAAICAGTSHTSLCDSVIDSESINCEACPAYNPQDNIICEPCQAYVPQESITCETCPAYATQDSRGAACVNPV